MHVVYGIPITTLIFRNYYETVPNELIEAARAGWGRDAAHLLLGGATDFCASFVVVLIWQFTSAWNDFLFALFFGGGAQNGPVTLALSNLAHGSILADYGASMSGALIASVILSGRALAPLAQIAGLATRFQQAKLALQGVNDIVSRPIERSPERKYITLDNVQGAITFENVSFKYQQDSSSAVSDLRITIRPGEKSVFWDALVAVKVPC